MFHVFSLAPPPPQLVFHGLPPRLAGRARNFSMSHGLYMERIIPSYFCIISSYFLRIPPYFFIFLHIFFIFLHILQIPFIFPSYFFAFPSYSWDLEKFQASPSALRKFRLHLYIGPGTYKKIRAISSMDMKHVPIVGTWTGIFLHFEEIF